MVSVTQHAPEFVLNADVDAYVERADPDPQALQRLREADRDETEKLLARGWFRHFHGSRNEAKRLFVLLMKEEGIPFNGEDIQAITGRPPVETQT
jgi:hypothetical protein